MATTTEVRTLLPVKNLEKRIEAAFEKHKDECRTIVLEDYSADTEMLVEIDNSGETFMDAVREICEAPELILEIMEGMSFSRDEVEKLTGLLEDKGCDMYGVVAQKGFALIKIDNLKQSQELEAFVNEHIHPYYRDQEQNIYP